jgi:hypothetical protein
MPATTADQRTLWPGYVYPGVWDPATAWLAWARTAQRGFDGSGSVAVMNPASGPGSAAVPDWTAAVNHARNLGHRVVGYTHTSYAARPVADVQAEVDRYYAWYGVDGVLIDEMSNDAATKSYYQGLAAYVRTKPGARLVVGNPGAAATTDWQLKAPTSADLLVVHENTAAAYLTWTAPAWVGGYPASAFAHLVHTCAAADLPTVVARSRAQRAGYRYVTSDGMPNPYDTLPGDVWPAQATP